VAIYSSFLQRAYDQILHDVGLQKLPVIFAIDRAGVVGEDGQTHQGIFDIAFLSTVPYMHILTPKTTQEIEAAMKFALNLKQPCAIRYPKGSTEIKTTFDYEKSQQMFDCLIKGDKIVLLAVGPMVELALKIQQKVASKGQKVGVVAVQRVWPLQEAEIEEVLKGYEEVVTIEDHLIEGGFGAHLASYLKQKEKPQNIHCFGYSDPIIEHGKRELVLEKYGLNEEEMSKKVLALVQKEGK